MLETTSLQLNALVPPGDCEPCATRLRDTLARVDGVAEAAVDLPTRSLRLKYDPEAVSFAGIEQVARDTGSELTRRFAHESLTVTGMDCADCALKLERGVGRLAGVESVNVNFTAARMRVEFDPDRADRHEIVHRVASLGYGVAGDETLLPGEQPLRNVWRVNERAVATCASGALIALGFILQWAGLGLGSTLAFATAIVVGGARIAVSGLAGLRTGTLDINFLMAVAAIGAGLIGEWAEGASVVFLFAVGELLESFTMERTRRAIHSLVAIAPRQAAILHGDHEHLVPVTEVQVGDLMVVRPGERIAMDGTVERGGSSVNQAPITGEPYPVSKVVGDTVFAGTLNEDGALEVRVQRLAEDNTVARIIRAVEEAQGQKAPSQRFVDTFARYYTPAVVVLAVLVAVLPPALGFLGWSEAIHRALVLLVISCPCALVISTPVAVVAAIGSAARHGVLIKGGRYLEALGGIRAVAFDKTGTLTTGTSEVTDVIPIGSIPEGEVLRVAASLEQRSQHPLGHAILRAAAARELAVSPVEEFQSLPGRGARGRVDGREFLVGNARLFGERAHSLDRVAEWMEGLQLQGKTAVLLGDASGVLGVIALRDQPRELAQGALDGLKSAGVERVVMLTGDTERTARAVAQHVGLTDVMADLLPEDKVAAIRELAQSHGSVAMVGDGVNDAPALAAATVGIAMGAAGTDVALETADVALMGDDLSLLHYAVRVSRNARSIIRQNILFSVGIKLLFLLLLIPGWTTLWLAVLSDTGATVLVVLNSLRLLRLRRGDTPVVSPAAAESCGCSGGCH